MKVAITGMIGSGKSTLCQILREMDYEVFDCDKRNKELLNDGNEGFMLIKEYFPECIVNNHLDKKKLAEIIFNDSAKKEQLESLLHPLILVDLLLESQKIDPFFAEVPLLFEKSYEDLFDMSILVLADDEIIKTRLQKRGLSDKEITLRINNQMSIQHKIMKADKIIYNNKGINELKEAVEELIKEIC